VGRRRVRADCIGERVEHQSNRSRSPQLTVGDEPDRKTHRRHIVEQDIGSCSLPSYIARAISARPNSPALRVIQRLSPANDGHMHSTIGLYPADRFRYFQALQRL
jgi:hypothetical protein